MKKTINTQATQQTFNQETLKLFECYFDGTEGWKYAPQAKYTPTDIFTRAYQASAKNTSLETVCKVHHGCSADRVHDRLGDLTFESTVQRFNDMYRDITQRFQYHGNKVTTVSCDLTDKPYYGSKEQELCLGSKPKEGTYWFNRYFTACLNGKSVNLPVYGLPLRQEDDIRPGSLIWQFFRETHHWLGFSRVLLDGYFVASEVFNCLDHYQCEYLMNMKRTKAVKKQTQEILNKLRKEALSDGVNVGRPKAFYRWIKKKGQTTHHFTVKVKSASNRPIPVVLVLVLVRRYVKGKGWRWKLEPWSYTTNIQASGDYLVKLYKSRWGIETQYRVAHQFQATTTSPKTMVRVFLYLLGFVLLGLWCYLNLLLNREIDIPTSPRKTRPLFPAYVTDRILLTSVLLLELIKAQWTILEEVQL